MLCKIIVHFGVEKLFSPIKSYLVWLNIIAQKLCCSDNMHRSH